MTIVCYRDALHDIALLFCSVLFYSIQHYACGVKSRNSWQGGLCNIVMMEQNALNAGMLSGKRSRPEGLRTERSSWGGAA